MSSLQSIEPFLQLVDIKQLNNFHIKRRYLRVRKQLWCWNIQDI